MKPRASSVLVSIAAALLAVFSIGCDGNSGVGTSETGICSIREATFGPSGELTAFPDIATQITGATLEVRSVNFIAVPGTADTIDYVETLVEVENVGTDRICAASFDGTFVGRRGPAALAASAYEISTPAISFGCLEPRRTGVIRAIFRDVTEDDLLSATSLRFALANRLASGMGETRLTQTTLTQQRIEEVEGGFQLVQTVTAERNIFNYYQSVYAVDARGLLIADLDVPSYGPTSGGAALTAGRAQELRSNVLGCEFVGFVVAQEHYQP